MENWSEGSDLCIQCRLPLQNKGKISERVNLLIIHCSSNIADDVLLAWTYH